MPIVETDYFLESNQNKPEKHRDKELGRAIKSRLDRDGPVIVDGVFLLRTLSRLGLTPDFLVFTKNQSFEGCAGWQEDYKIYERNYAPRSGANFIFLSKEDTG